MRVANQGTRPARRWNRLALVGLVLTGLMAMAIFVLLPRLKQSADGGVSALTEPPSRQRQATPAPNSTGETRGEVVGRLHQIFEIRDTAIRTRNPLLLEDIYTVDCPCLDGDQKLIRRLKKERLLWRDLKVSVKVKQVEKVNDQLWIVTGLVTTSSFEIVKESGAVIRKVLEGREYSRFALARPIGRTNWLLGRASVMEGRD
jgi:hypothetical protein